MIADYILRGQLHVLCQEYPIRGEETGARWLEASATIQGEMWGMAGCRSGAGEGQLDPGDILKLEFAGLLNRLDMGSERKREVQGGNRFLTSTIGRLCG